MGEKAIRVTRLLVSAQSAKKKKGKRRKKRQARMLREIFKAVLADFCRETG